ncbi:putative glucuronokinase 2 [Gracilariopsis chorda]|uniref:Putative glucuronokinase 2 n=1 Tax=Gracilariopsis chorda TaxID=448386 RepID=A0A2V3IR51_9FLOR|nr:putative glucuronokinase 2 [Gracilariopsis chorda]|eukprot:PXF44588.1 putative glucuronokinase 2 [Gracilariopsis chorda]
MHSFGIVLLAAGYGTRLAADISQQPHFHQLANTPKPLLPLAGRPILSHWIRQLSVLPCISSVVVVTNALHYPLYRSWAAQLSAFMHHANAPQVHLLSDASTCNHNRLGAIKAIALGLHHLDTTAARNAIIIAGDCLFPHQSILPHIQQFCRSQYHAAAFAYRLHHISDSRKRGMFSTRIMHDGTTIATQLIEKPQHTASLTSDLASAPVYMLKKDRFGSAQQFLQQHSDQPLSKRDAPGFWLSWLIAQHAVCIYTVRHRLDVGNLEHYKTALWTLTLPTHSSSAVPLPPRCASEPAIGRAYPRVGILGNPSDGFQGKVISASISSEGYAEVVANPSDKFTITPNEHNEFFVHFDNLSHLLHRFEEKGIYFSARPLIGAASITFANIYHKYKLKGEHITSIASLHNCNLTYSTNIPMKLGLSGSSALILATLRALARFHNTTLEQICPDIKVWADAMRKAEVEILGIAGGRQDPVMALMQGCVLMDFTGGGLGTYERLDETLLPDMWLCYHDKRAGESSGKVHGNLRARYARGDETITRAVRELIDLADEGTKMLKSGDWQGLPRCFDRNFELRVELVGADAIGDVNMNLTRVAREAGFSAKMTGSGGCAVCIPNPLRKLSPEEINSARSVFTNNGLVFRKVKVLSSRPWQTS